MYVYACIALIVLGMLSALIIGNFTIALVSIMGAFIIVMLFKNPMQ